MIVYLYNNLNESHIIRRDLYKQNPLSVIWMTPEGEIIDMDTIDATIEAVHTDLYENYPELYEVIKHKDVFYTDHPDVDTMMTTGEAIYINPAFCHWIMTNFEGEEGLFIEYVIIHEILHILFDHCNAIDNPEFNDLLALNYAMDYEINYIIENFLFDDAGDLPFKGITKRIEGLINDTFGKNGLTWEEIYRVMPLPKRTDYKKKMSKEWNTGFLDGFSAAMSEMRKNNLIERYDIR